MKYLKYRSLAVAAQSVPLERKPQSELHNAREIILAGDLPEIGASATTRIGWIKLHSIEEVEKLRPELKTKPFIRTEFGIFERCEVEIFHPVGP